MAQYIVMPKLGFDMREGVLVNWLREVGDTINKGDIVAEIESDKATLELESPVAGVLLKKLAEAGDVVPIGDNLAVVGKAGEKVEGNGRTAAVSAPQPEQPSPPATETPVAKPAVSGAYPGGVKASPVARRMAQEYAIDLTQLSGSGPDGRIRRADVAAFVEGRRVTAAPPPTPAPVAMAEEVTEVPTSRLRQAIGRRMTESKTTIPHFYVTAEMDVAPLVALRQQINALLPEDGKISLNDMVVKAAALALRDFPNLNASLGEGKVIRHNHINVGSAVAVEGGLLTVVQKDTDKTPLAQIAADNRTMIARARAGKILPADVTDGTFTVSNLGPYDVENFIAIINPPEAAILAVGTARQVAVVVNGEIRVGTRMKATISADHRVTDGAEAARFMQKFKAFLEEPLRLLL
ncbi:MAG: dihydrolipoamide acetyltransferase family protein [Chloroflexota bacterium]